MISSGRRRCSPLWMGPVNISAVPLLARQMYDLPGGVTVQPLGHGPHAIPIAPAITPQCNCTGLLHSPHPSRLRTLHDLHSQEAQQYGMHCAATSDECIYACLTLEIAARQWQQQSA